MSDEQRIEVLADEIATMIIQQQGFGPSMDIARQAFKLLQPSEQQRRMDIARQMARKQIEQGVY